MKNQQKIYVSILVIAVAAAAFVFVLRRHVTPPPAVTDASMSAMPATTDAGDQTAANPQDLKVSFMCDAGKTMTASFHLTADQGVDLMLSDGRSMSLKHVDSADSAQYVSADGNTILWSKGQGTFLQEGSATTYSNCQLENNPTAPTAAQ